jgi:hypothetical protein
MPMEISEIPSNYRSREKIISAPSMMQQTDIVTYMLKCSRETVTDIKNSLSGQVRGSDGKPEAFGQPKMNQDGVAELIGFLSAFLSPNIFLSVFTREDIAMHCKFVEYELNDYLTNYENWNKWELDPLKIPMIREMLMAQIRAAYNRAREYNKEYGAFGGTTQAITQQAETHEIISREKTGFKLPSLGGNKNG